VPLAALDLPQQQFHLVFAFQGLETVFKRLRARISLAAAFSAALMWTLSSCGPARAPARCPQSGEPWWRGQQSWRGDARPSASRSGASLAQLLLQLAQRLAQVVGFMLLVLGLVVKPATSWSWLSARSSAPRARSSWPFPLPAPPCGATRGLGNVLGLLLLKQVLVGDAMATCVFTGATGSPCPAQSVSTSARDPRLFYQVIQIRAQQSANSLQQCHGFSFS